MKKSLFLILLFAGLTVSEFSASAVEPNEELSEVSETEASWNAYRDESGNVLPNLRYRQLKTIYNPRDYSFGFMDRYSPWLSGIGSLIIPGLGECIGNEWGRGLWKFGLSTVLTVAYFTTFAFYTNPEVFYITNIAIGAALIGVRIWSIVDAVKIAKVKNLYDRDLMGQGYMSLNMYPSLNYIPSGNGFKAAPGLTLALSF